MGKRGDRDERPHSAVIVIDQTPRLSILKGNEEVSIIRAADGTGLGDFMNPTLNTGGSLRWLADSLAAVGQVGEKPS